MLGIDQDNGGCCCGQSMDDRKNLISGLRGLADFLSAHPLPLPLIVQADVYLDGGGSGDMVRAFGSLYNAALKEDPNYVTATKNFGPVSYNLIHITSTASVRSGDAA